MKKLVCSLLVASILCPAAYFSVNAAGNTYYVSQAVGSDSNDGTSEGSAFATIQKAADVAKAGDTVLIAGGEYHEQVKMTNSGTEDEKITFKNLNEDKPVITTAEEVTGFTEVGNNVYKAKVDMTLEDRNQVFFDGKSGELARFPNNKGSFYEPTLGNVVSATTDEVNKTQTIVYEEESGDLDFTGATFWISSGAQWVTYTRTVKEHNKGSKSITVDTVNTAGSYVPKAGNPYYVSGLKQFLDYNQEWWYDEENGELYVYLDGKKPEDVSIEVKTRNDAISMEGVSNVVVDGIDIVGGRITFDENTNYNKFTNMKIYYVANSNLVAPGEGKTKTKGIEVNGNYNEFNKCELAYSTTDVIDLYGTGNKIVNSLLHDGCMVDAAGGIIYDYGKNSIISHNTGYGSGRFIIGFKGRSCIIQYNDLYDGNSVTTDAGLFYGCYMDAEGTSVRYNWMHDNLAKDKSNGIYFDWGSTNVNVHHNVVWNVPYRSLITAGPGENFLVYNNTFINGTLRESDVAFGQFMNNIIVEQEDPVVTTSHYVASNNIIKGTDAMISDPANKDFTLKEGSPAINAGIVIPGIAEMVDGKNPSVGAYEYGKEKWVAGCDFSKDITVEYEPDVNPYMNKVKNSSFEDANFVKGTMEPWTKLGTGTAALKTEMCWNRTDAATRNRNYSLEVKDDGEGISQVIEGLEPNTKYIAYVYAKVVNTSDKMILNVKDYGGETVSASTSEFGWDQLAVTFTTGVENTTATIEIVKYGSNDVGYADCVGLTKYIYNSELSKRLLIENKRVAIMDDLYVRGGSYVDQNYCLSQTLEYKLPMGYTPDKELTQYDRRVLFKTSLADIDPNIHIKQAIFHIHGGHEPWGDNAGKSAGLDFKLYPLLSDDWSMYTITANDIPDVGEAIATIQYGEDDPKNCTFDITEYVKSELKGDKTVAFEIREESPTAVNVVFDSNDSVNKPYIEIITEESEKMLEQFSNAVVLKLNSSEAAVMNNVSPIDPETDLVVPKIVNDRTLVPVRFISEAFDADVSWDQATSTVTIKSGDFDIVMQINNPVIKVNGQDVQIDAAPIIENERTLIPLRAMAESINKKVFWDDRGLIVISDTADTLDSVNDNSSIEYILGQLS